VLWVASGWSGRRRRTSGLIDRQAGELLEPFDGDSALAVQVVDPEGGSGIVKSSVDD
jgi:hypothetical protein